MKDIAAHATDWQKSSFSSEEGSCLELATNDHTKLAIRESDYPDTVLTTAPHRVLALLQGVKTGMFDWLPRS